MTDQRTSVVPDVIDALVELCRDSLPYAGITVSDGQPLEWEVGDWLYVGVTDADSPTPTPASTVTQEWPLATAAGRDENGTITCVAYVLRPEAVMKDARDAAFDLVGVVQDVLRLDTRLGIPGMKRTSFASFDFDQGQTQDGALAIITFRIEFSARI